jgi:undecaprenyl-diphosphatase
MDGNLVHAAILGIVQGLTEFLPISSSAHLILVPYIFGWTDPFIDSAAFDVMLHMGTLLALLAYFWRDLVRLLGAWLASLRDRRIGDDPDRRLSWLLIISVIPAAILGAALESFFDRTFREHISWIAVLIVVGAALLWFGERVGTRSRSLEKMRVPDAVTIGVAQALALFPGISRSGITIATGLFIGLEREAAARFSFLMAVPVIAGAGLWKARTLIGADLGGAQVNELVVGVVTAAIFGFIAIASLLRFLRSNPTTVFIVYRVVLAAVVVVAWLGLSNR